MYLFKPLKLTPRLQKEVRWSMHDNELSLSIICASWIIKTTKMCRLMLFEKRVISANITIIDRFGKSHVSSTRILDYGWYVMHWKTDTANLNTSSGNISMTRLFSYYWWRQTLGNQLYQYLAKFAGHACLVFIKMEKKLFLADKQKPCLNSALN